MTPPPFDPPYIKKIETADGIRAIETLTDGSTREIPYPVFQAPPPALPTYGKQRNKPDRTVGASKGTNAANVPAKGNDRATLFLVVPFAEKDSAKGKGAKWDGAMRKWYVPHGADINAFNRWWPEELKKQGA